LAITYNAWSLTVNIDTDAAVVTRPEAASRIGILPVLCKPSPWLQARFDVLAASTGRSPTRQCPAPVHALPWNCRGAWLERPIPAW